MEAVDIVPWRPSCLLKSALDVIFSEDDDNVLFLARYMVCVGGVLVNL